MKYDKEYISSNNKKEFVKKLLDRYPYLKESTAERRWYDLKKHNTRKTFIKVSDGDVIVKPNMIKIKEYKEIKEMGFKITYEILKSNGFSKGEINWIVKYGVKND